MTSLLLAGATGLVGKHALALLLRDERVTDVVAPTRRPLVPHRKLLNPMIDNTNLLLDASWWSVDAALCALGTTRAQAGSASAFRAIDFDYPLAIAAQVRSRGATRFALTSSMGANPRSRFLYTRTKGELEAALGRLDFASLTFVRPGLLGGDRDEKRTLERITGTLLRAVAPLLPVSARISPAATVAGFLVEGAIGGASGTHVVTSGQIARAVARA